MSLQRKWAMLGASLRLGRTWGDRLELLRLFAKHGGLMPYAGDHQLKSIGTSFEGAPRLHFRESGPDGILIAELLVEEAILVVLTIDLETEIYRISDRHAIISEDVRRAQEQWLLYSTVHQYKINCCKSLAKIVPRDC